MREGSRSSRWGAVALLAALAFAGPARATPPGRTDRAASDEAKRLAQLSIREYEALEFERALADAVKAFELSGAPELLFNLGQCHRALAHWKQAEQSYRNYLHEKPNAPNRAIVVQLIAEMRAKPTPASVAAKPVAPVLVLPTPAAEPGPAAAEVRPDWMTETSAVTEPVSKPRSSAWPWVFGVAAVVAVGASVWGWAEVATFESLKTPSTVVTVAQAESARSAAAVGEPVGIIGIVAAAGLATGLVLTW